ncbi:MAG TPA: hypothetical protein VGD58_02865 [Herpetosiphonaceae bacterium]
MRQEPILVQEKRFNLLPYRFLHRGVVRRVQRVERSWDVGARWGRHPGHYFRVRCQDGATCDLFHDVILNMWYIKQTGSVLERAFRNRVLGKGTLKWIFT